MTLDDASIEAGLAKVLAEAGWPDPLVRMGDTASAGANRSTRFVEIESDGTTTAAVVQLGGLQLASLSMANEAETVRLADDGGVPVATPLAASDHAELVGAPFQLSKRIDGVTVPRHVLRAVAEQPDLGPLLTRQCGEALARLHAIDAERAPVALPRLTEPTTSLAYRRQLHDLAALAAPSPAIALGLRWLAAHEPTPPDRPVIVHSDFRNGNLIVHDQGLAAVIDWELAHLGDPMEDLAWLCLRCWRFRADDHEVGGFGDLVALRDAYLAVGGTWRPDAFQWWQVARTIWWCLVLRLQASAFVAGTSSSLVLAASGRRAAELEYDLLVLIPPA